jgi:hypothetical protein
MALHILSLSGHYCPPLFPLPGTIALHYSPYLGTIVLHFPISGHYCPLLPLSSIRALLLFLLSSYPGIIVLSYHPYWSIIALLLSFPAGHYCSLTWVLSLPLIVRFASPTLGLCTLLHGGMILLCTYVLPTSDFRLRHELHPLTLCPTMLSYD